MRELSLAVVVLVSAGCATVTPLHEESLAEVQSFADEVSRVYQFPPVQMAVGDKPEGYYRIRVLKVTPAILDAPLPVRDVAVALLLAFWLIQPPEPMSEPQEVEINRRAYPEMNVAAVNILARVKGLPEGIAVRGVHAYLAAQADGLAEKRLSWRRTVPHPCDQLKKFIVDSGVRLGRKYPLDLPASCR